MPTDLLDLGDALLRDHHLALLLVDLVVDAVLEAADDAGEVAVPAGGVGDGPGR